MTVAAQDILARAAALCTPTAKEEARTAAVAEEAKILVEGQANDSKEIVGVVFGGSFAKGTWLRSDADVDIFIKIKPEVDEKRFEELGVGMGKKALKKFEPQLRYSDHPYVEAVVKGTRINVVPCYDVEKGRWKSAADRSPFHTQYIAEALDGAKKGEVRLLKKFLKAAGVYGAEISTGGFSGYVSEVLVAKFGSFEGVLNAAADFKQGQVVAVVDNYDVDVVKGFQSPIVIIDPVDPRRNLATAVSPESAGRFALAARAFLKKPSMKSFARQPARVNRRLYPNIIAVEFSHRKRSADTIWGQMKRSAGSLAKQLELAGFTVFRHTCSTDEETSGAFAFMLESLTLPPYAARRGPQIFRRSDTDSFVARANKSSGPLAMWVDREIRVSVIARRRVTDARKLLRTLLQNKDSGVARDMITGKLQIYSGSERRLSGQVKAAVDELSSTESLIIRV